MPVIKRNDIANFKCTSFNVEPFTRRADELSVEGEVILWGNRLVIAKK